MTAATTPLNSAARSVALVTLGCARNEVDSEELAGRLAAEGWLLVDDADDADVAVVNTCGFVEQAKKDSIDALLEASERKGQRPHPGGRRGGLPRRAVRRAAGRPAARGRRGARVRLLRRHVERTCTPILRRARPASHVPRDRRRLLPLSPAARQQGAAAVACPGTGPDGSTLPVRGRATAPR